jgi:ribosomal protein S18 acetylase RimI-like enzyme
MSEFETVNIRVFSESDRAVVRDLWLEAFGRPAPHNDYDKIINEKQTEQPELFFVAELNGLLVGTAMCGWDGHRGWVYSVATRKSARRSGIGRALMERVEKELAARGCPKLNLQVRAGNEEVVAFYETLGYSVEHRISMAKLLK